MPRWHPERAQGARSSTPSARDFIDKLQAPSTRWAWIAPTRSASRASRLRRATCSRRSRPTRRGGRPDDGRAIVGTWVIGRQGNGAPREVYLYQMTDAQQCWREFGLGAVAWQTGFNPVIAMELLASGTWSGSWRARPRRPSTPTRTWPCSSNYGIHYAMTSRWSPGGTDRHDRRSPAAPRPRAHQAHRSARGGRVPARARQARPSSTHGPRRRYRLVSPARSSHMSRTRCS